MAVILTTVTSFISLFSIIGIEETFGRRVHPLSSNFNHLVNYPGFVDKTLLIKTVLESPDRILITAPSKFGKSMILDMLKRFFEIRVDRSNGIPITAAVHETDFANDTRNYKLFRGLKIDKHPDIMRRYFGKYPVIRANYLCYFAVKYREEGLDYITGIVKGAYLEHNYLMNSEKLTDSERMLARSWYELLEEIFPSSKVRVGLQMLTELLYKHFNHTKVVVLIDEYESVISEAILNGSSEKDLKSIVDLYIGTISFLLKRNPYVERVIMTGKTCLGGVNMSVIGNNVVTYKFLEDHPFVDYYGLTRHEVDHLLSKPEFNLTEMPADRVREYYGGYVSKTGHNIYSPFSVMNFLRTGSFSVFWSRERYFSGLRNMLGVTAVSKSIAAMLQNNSTIEINICERIRLEDLVMLRKACGKSKYVGLVTADVYLSLLLDLGYLTQAPEKRVPLGKTAVKIPNQEIRRKLDKACSTL